jgi:methylenetetrahydrofolate reductase (NADPH)
VPGITSVVEVSDTTDAAQRSTIENFGRPDPQCPKHMVYGPCGGVRENGDCELGDRRCPFVDRALVHWDGPHAESNDWRPFSTDGAGIVIDLRVRPFDVGSIDEVTRRLAGSCDAVLIGEHHARPDFPPTFIAAVVNDAGGRPWVTLTCRDRNRVVLEAEIEALAVSDVAGVHCVTGDARAPSVRVDASQVFDLDSVRLTALARYAELRVSVAATPLAPPTDQRPLRLLEKQRAGATVCFVNHAGGVDGVRRFIAAARDAGVRMSFIPCIPVITDIASWRVLEGFPGLVLDDALRQRVLQAADPRQAGIDAAIEQAMAMLEIEGVAAINLSGAATSGTELDGAAIMAEIAGSIRERVSIH